MASENVTKEQSFLRKRQNFRKNAFQLISEILELSMEPSVSQELVDEALHSIFFLGEINKISPDEIFTDKEVILETLRQSCPEPFELCSSQLPKRHPMSCVLDMVVRASGERDENSIKQRLQQINSRLSRGRKVKFLISSTLCVSQNTEIPDSVRYYGVSMSTSGSRLRDIMISASCCTYWDSHVAGAVLTYYPVQKTDFDGTITLTEKARCQAFKIRDGTEMPPCESCGDLFGLCTSERHKPEKQEFAYGSCAEIESVSNLFKNERGIKEQSQLRSDTNTAESRRNAKIPALQRLVSYLNEVGFKWDNKFYPNLEQEIIKRY